MPATARTTRRSFRITPPRPKPQHTGASAAAVRLTTAERAIAGGFLASVARTLAMLSEATLTRQLADGGSGPETVLRSVEDATAAGYRGRLRAALTALLRQVARDAVVRLTQRRFQAPPPDLPLDEPLIRIDLAGSFVLDNPAVLRWIEQYAATLISGISAPEQQRIRELAGTAYREGVPPRALAKQIRGSIGLLPRHAAAVDRMARAQVASGSVPTLEAAYEKPAIVRYHDRLLAHRAKTIARTETLRAQNAGQDVTWRSAVHHGLLAPDVQRRWIVGQDARLCPHCRELSGTTKPLGEAFTAGPFTALHPPLHVACRCTLAVAVVVPGP